ncbi:MAG: SH3 domain-containing protein [Chloroflexota bacterium]|nr:SH3 domain-containing protein [Chloroflexota bacterium]
MRRIGYLLAALVLVASVPLPGATLLDPAVAVAQNALTATTATTIDDVNLRTGPSLSSDVITVLPVESRVTLTGQQVSGYRSVTWNGQAGWVFGTYLSIDSPSPSPSASATTTDRLNLRSEPTLIVSDILTVIPAGAQVTLTGESVNGFRSVTYNGFTGWVSAQYLDFGSTPAPVPQPEPDATAITTSTLNLRSGPGADFSVITVMPQGSEVVLTGQESNGYQSVSYNGRNGWAAEQYLALPGTIFVPSGTAVTTEGVNLRAGPDASYAVQTVVPAGVQVALTGQTNNGYHAVSWNGFNGWIFSAYLDIEGTSTPATVIFRASDSIVGPVRGSVDEAMAFANAYGADRIDEVERYIVETYRLAPEIGFDPAILVAQSAHETGNWRSSWWNERLNPAGIGVTGDPAQNAASPIFPSGTIAARAQIAHMHAEVYGSSRPLPDILQGVDPTYQRVFEAGWAGTIRTIEDLTGTWAVDPEYHNKLVRKGNVIFGDDPRDLVAAIVAILRDVLRQAL